MGKFHERFEDLRESVIDVAQAGMSKARELGTAAKLNVGIAAEEDAIKKTCTELGRRYYASQGDQPGQEYADLCARIDASKAKIADYRAKLADLKDDDRDETVVAEAAYTCAEVITDFPPEETEEPPAPAEEVPAPAEEVPAPPPVEETPPPQW